MLNRMASVTLALAVAATTAIGASSTAPPAEHAAIGAFGLDLSGGDPSAKPGDDFYTYANGRWQEKTQIPPDRSSWGSFIMLRERSLEQLRGILEALPAHSPAGSNEQKLYDFYRAYLDT
ncbi:MAG TPA: M13 family metallopeptidase N-terminal domain-containing protein, partial [Steroidobacteraceae bacterium]|nr:M13 family metallopeptidase N-terminal domain-containing protein [Steroidobacteraceae bacterium]